MKYFVFVFSGKMQHSVWAAEFIESNLEASASCSSGIVPDAVLSKRVSFRRIWQAKGAKKAASKVTNLSNVLAVGHATFI